MTSIVVELALSKVYKYDVREVISLSAFSNLECYCSKNAICCNVVEVHRIVNRNSNHLEVVTINSVINRITVVSNKAFHYIAVRNYIVIATGRIRDLNRIDYCRIISQEQCASPDARVVVDCDVNINSFAGLACYFVNNDVEHFSIIRCEFSL